MSLGKFAKPNCLHFLSILQTRKGIKKPIQGNLGLVAVKIEETVIIYKTDKVTGALEIIYTTFVTLMKIVEQGAMDNDIMNAVKAIINKAEVVE